MRKNATKLAAAVLSLAMVMTSVNMPASAAKTKVKLNKTKATLYVNGSKSEKATTLKVTVNGKKVNATFKSSNTKVLTVAKKTGKVTAKKNGTAKVTATYKKKKYNCTVTVKTYATSVSITSAKTLNLAAGKTATIKATVKPSTASNKKVSFASSNKNVATVTSAGKVTAKKAGTATVTVKALGSKKAAKKATVKVNVKAAVKPSTEPTTTPTTEPTATPETPVATEGAITVTTNVSGAAIEVVSGSSIVATGTAVGTSFTTDKLPEGTYTINVKKDGYEDATKVASIVDGDVNVDITLVEKVIKIVSVKTINNNKQFVVEFSKAVDKKTLTTANVALSEATTVALASLTEGTDYTISADKKTVTFNLTTAASQQETCKVTLKNIKDTDGNVFPEYTESIKFFDNVAPTVNDVKANGSKTIEVKFSEPIQTAPNAKVTMSGSVYQVTPVLSSDKMSATIAMPVDMVAGTHTVEFEAGADYANFKMDKVTKSFTFEKDTTAVVATLKESTEYTATIKFNKNVPGFDTITNYKFAHSYKGKNEVTNSAITKIADDEYKVTFTSPFAPGSSKLYFYYNDNVADDNKVKDSYGNILAPFELNINTVEDKTAPAVSSVVFKDATTLTITFTEEVDPADAKNTANYVLKDSTGKVIGITGIADADTSNPDNKTFTITTDTINGGTYSLEVNNIKDKSIAGNKMTKATINFTATDKVAPTVVTSAEVINATKIRIKFSEAMDKASIEDKANYAMNGVALDSKAIVTAAADRKSVVIDFSKLDTKPDFTTTGTTISVGQVKDIAGNKTTNFVTTVTVTSVAVPVIGIKEANMISKDKIQVVVEDALTLKADAKISVTTDGASYNDLSVESVSVVNNVTTLTVKLTTPIANTEATNVKVKLDTGSDSIKNGDGQFLQFGETAVKDKIAPEVKSVKTKDNDGNGKIDTIDVEFSEALYAGSVTASDFTVEGYTVDGIKSISGATVSLAIKESSYSDTGATPKVTVVGSVEDLNKNASAAQTTGVAAVDSAKPVATVASSSTDKQLILIVSESVASIEIVSGGTLSDATVDGKTIKSTTGAIDGSIVKFTVKDSVNNTNTYTATYTNGAWKLELATA